MARNPASRANNLSPDAGSEPKPGSAREAPANGARSGQDERRRGWYWHWNGVVTQYTPLIGLKGIGLLNSYTVWTDRREDSPHRGYAFPSQQSEANFYGEDRAELITINKILVALDLIEIRKEMVRKTDAQGRRWKVPQNLYRVKDRQDGLDLTTADVIRVVELADRDKAVYRYVRKIFSSRFEPIDRNNAWHAILEELEDHPTWEKLAARAAKQEARASARTKAGHRSRARQLEQEQTDAADSTSGMNGEEPDAHHSADSPQPAAPASALLTSGHIQDSTLPDAERGADPGVAPTTTDEPANSGSPAVAEESNNGLETPVEPGDNGSSSPGRGSVAKSNNGRQSSVEPGNTMYYQAPSTTTTTTSAPKDDEKSSAEARAVPVGQFDGGEFEAKRVERAGDAAPTHAPSTGPDSHSPSGGASPGAGAAQSSVARTAGAGPVADPSALALSLYEAANDRPATRLERILLSELEAHAAAPATAAGSTGSAWVAAALREAVGSGSAFVAPKRIREIINRWAASESGPRGPAVTDSERGRAQENSSATLLPKQARDEVLERSIDDVVRIGRDDAAQGARLWDVVLDLLAAGDLCDELFRLQGVVPLGEREDGVFVLGTPTRAAARLLDGRYREHVEQALSSLFPSPVSITALSPDQWTID